MAIATVGSLVVVQSSATSVSTSITVPSGATHALVWGGGGNDGELPASISIGGQAGTFLIAQSLTAGGAYWLALVPISGSGSQTLAVADWNVGQGVSYMVRFLTATETVSVRDTADAFDEDITSLNPGSLDATAGDYVFAGSGTFPGGITFTWTNATELDEDGFNDISASVAEDDSASGAVTITATFSSEAEAAWIAAVALTDEEAADEITFGSGADNATLTWETIAPEDGDLILLAIANDGGDDQTAPTDWTAVTANGATADVEGMIYKWKADGTESGTIIANEGSFGVTGEEYCFHWWKIPASLWSGDLDEVEVSAVQEATSGTINPNNLTVAGWDGTAEDWLAFVFAVRDDDDGISSLGANYTATFQYTQSASSTGSCEIASAWRTISGSDSENPGAATQTNTNEGLRSWTVGVRGPVDAEPELAVEEATEADVASDVSLIVEPRLTVEQGAEDDVAADVSLTAEPVFVVDLNVSVITVEGTVTAANAAAEEVTVAKPTGTTIGEVLVIVVGNADNSNTAQWDNTTLKPPGFTMLNEYGNAATDTHGAAFYRVVDGSEGASFTIPHEGGEQEVWAICFRLSGVDVNDPVNVIGSDVLQTTDAASIDITGVTTDQDGCAAFSAWTFDRGSSFLPHVVSGTGWTQISEHGQGGSIGASGGVAIKQMPVAGATGTCTVTRSNGPTNDTWAGFQWAFNAAPPQPASEDDVAFDVVLATETEFAAELATEENVAFDVEFAVDTGMAAEQATEEDVAQDVLLQTEPALDIEPASEDDQANDVVLAAEQAFTVEAAAEEDTAQDVVMAAEPVFIVEAASEDDVAEDVALLAEPVFVVEQAAEEDEAEDVQIGAASEFTTDEAVEIDQAFDVVIAAEPVFIVEPAVEDDTAEDIALSTDRAFIVEPASEDDVAEDVVLEAVATVFTVEPAAEEDQAFDVIIAVEPVFLVELATEIDLAREIDLDVGQPVKLGDVFCEMLAPTCGQTLLAPSVSAIVVDIDMVASTHGPRVATAIIGPSVTSEVE